MVRTCLFLLLAAANPAAGRFLNPAFTDGGIRTMRGQLKLIF